MTRIPGPLRVAALAFAVALLAAPAEAQRVKPGKWRVNDEPEGWILAKSANYQIQSQVPRERALAVAAHLEAMMMEYRRRFKSKKPLPEFTLKIFKNAEEYHKYGAPPGSLAYYTDQADELVCFDTGTLDGREKPPDPAEGKDLKDRLKALGIPEEELSNVDLLVALKRLSTMPLLGVLSHEGWHQYFHFWIVSMVDFPSWLDEGMGDYFSTAVVSKDAKTVKCGEIAPIRFAMIHAAIRQGKHVPIADLIRFRQSDYYKNPGLCYAEGWSLVYFCYHSGNPRYKEIPDRIIEVFKDKHKMDLATDIAFKGIDLAKFEEDWKAFFLGLDFKETMIGIARERSGEDTTTPATTTEKPKPPTD